MTERDEKEMGSCFGLFSRMSLLAEVEKAMACRNLSFFIERCVLQDVVCSVVEKTNDVLFARLCHVEGCTFENVNPQLCTSEFALFMLQIINRKDWRYGHFLRRVSVDIHYHPSYGVPYGKDIDEFVTMIQIKHRTFKKDAFFDNHDISTDAIALALLCHYKPSFDQLFQHFLRTGYKPFAQLLKEYPEKYIENAYITKYCRLAGNYIPLKKFTKELSSELIPKFGNYEMAEALNLKGEKVVDVAMQQGNFSFFSMDTPLEYVAISAVKHNDVLFARWCYIRGWNFHEVDETACTPQFALFMAQISAIHRKEFLARISEDEKLLCTVISSEEVPYMITEDAEVAISMFKMKNGDFTLAPSASEDTLLLAALMGHGLPLEMWHRYTNYKRLIKYYIATTLYLYFI